MSSQHAAYDTTGASAHPPGSIGLNLFHVVVIVLSLVMTIGAWQFSKHQTETRTATRFAAERDRAVGLLAERVEKYEHALRAGAAMVRSHGGRVSRAQWKDFAEMMDNLGRYPGTNGFAVVHHIARADLPAYTAQRQADHPGFAVRPPHEQPFHLVIAHVEPEERNRDVLGLDLAHEETRREGALASRDSGTSHLSGPVALVNESGETPGVIFYTPIYAGESDMPETLAERRAAILGYANTAFVVRKLMVGLLSKDRREVHFSIADGDRTLYDEHSDGDPRNDPDPLFSDTVSLDLYGRTWTIDVRSTLPFRAANTYTQPTLILVGGLVIEGLIIAFLLLLTRANGRAVAYAGGVTADLQVESDKLAAANAALSDKNKELEQFAYVASHDLKTPLRGIGGLTEMLEDDLEDYLVTPDANPDVATNLERIRERVRRMNALTGGIMEFSRIGRFTDESTMVHPTDIVAGLRSDFGLDAEQLRFEGDVPEIGTDTFSLRRVIENLVGNAIKYHPDPESLRIRVSAAVDGDRMTLSVADNGPGIAPEYRERVFEMFQTLGTASNSESTGIGLAIVKKAVERHGGRVILEETPGTGGATFRFDWPLGTAGDIFTLTDKAA